jgi:hypothetical protein
VKERGAVENAEAPTTSRQDAARDFIMVELYERDLLGVVEDPRRVILFQRNVEAEYS